MTLIAYVRGKRVPWVWNDITKPTLSDERKADFHAEVMATILANLPRTRDLKLRQDAVTAMADELTTLLEREYNEKA